jgi:hypothetical protein
MKFRSKCLLGLSLIATASAGQAATPASDEKVHAVEVISPDATANTITIRSDKRPSTLVVGEKAFADLQRVKPGDKIAITVNGDPSGRRQMITAVVNGTISTPPEAVVVEETADEPVPVKLERTGPAVELIDLDPSVRRVTVLGDRGRKRVFAVDGKAMLSLTDVKPGQKVLLSYRFDAEGKTEAVVHVTPAAVLPTVKVESETLEEGKPAVIIRRE